LAAHPLFDTTSDLAERLRDWVEANPHASETVCDLLSRAATALDHISRGEEIDDDGRNGRQVTYKEVLATRGERHRSDGTPLWPLRPDDFPSSFGNSSPERSNGRSADDLPDWMR
jgi:hypothetical protein